MSSESVAGPPKGLPRVIGGYRVVREFGRGRLGTVALARHRATGRPVALKVLKPEWACLPKYVARLTRDAFAAAQVAHPNLVRVEALGEAGGRIFVATEYVEGASLAELVKGRGALPPPVAVAHVLQAARGLRYAHGHGLTHGAVTPGNLLVDGDGVTRLSDLGLTRTPSDVDDDARPIPVGDAAEAAADAAPIFADVRGLGLTLAFLLTGGADAHPGALIAAGLPMNLVELIRGMVEPRPGGAFADPTGFVPALERFLQTRGGGSLSPREDDTRVLTECVASFRASPSVRLRRRVVLSALAAAAFFTLLGFAARRPLFAGSVFGLAAMTALADFVAAGLTGRSPIFPKVRGLVLESRGADWLVAVAVVVVFISGLIALRLHTAWLAFGLLAVILAGWLHVAVDRRADAERLGAVEEARALLKRLRGQGLSEETLRQFVQSADAGGGEFFEALFGYEPARQSRDPSERGFRAVLRGRSAPWRDALASWVDSRQFERQQGRDRALLQAVEERGMVAEGVNLVTARRRALRVADAMLATASQIRAADAVNRSGAVTDAAPLANAVRRAARSPESVLVEHERGLVGPGTSRIRGVIPGARTRFLLGSVLLACFLLWVRRNEVISAAQITDVATRAIEARDPLGVIRGARVDVRLGPATAPLELPFVPRPVSHRLGTPGAGAAGFILVASALFGGSRVGLFALAGAFVAWLAPDVGVPPVTAVLAGVGVASLAFVFGGRRDD